MKNMRSLIVLIGAMSALSGTDPVEPVQLVNVQKLSPQGLYEKFLRLDLEERAAKIIIDCNSRIDAERPEQIKYTRRPEQISEEVFQGIVNRLSIAITPCH